MGVLLMLMTIGGVIFALILGAIALVTKRSWLLKFTLSAVAVWFAFYAAMLLGFSLTCSEQVLAVGEAKEYCGFYLDCHMHTALTGVRTSKTIGDRSANGTFYIANIKVFSDAKNSQINLHLIEPKARVVLANRDKISRDEAAEASLPSASVRLDQDITNYQTIEKEIVFDVPATTASPRLLITEGYGIDKSIEHVLVGDEDSLFHAQTFFELKEQNETVSVK